MISLAHQQLIQKKTPSDNVKKEANVSQKINAEAHRSEQEKKSFLEPFSPS